ncbi:hypothetical protein RRG08_015732 [Elysia crispata]|uniref:Uncharacterized protein n=1 Tax=Elysia crispata TaxID=231223 RepID=A0AAE1DA50_9GAST|nr:hypothetical protein RRG08_015732 [Elysia crispata]
MSLLSLSSSVSQPARRLTQPSSSSANQARVALLEFGLGVARKMYRKQLSQQSPETKPSLGLEPKPQRIE